MSPSELMITADNGARLTIAGLTADSREVKPGMLFAAIPGSRMDGRDFIAQALEKGAAAILAPTGTSLPAGSSAALLTDGEPRRRLAELAAAFYQPQPATMVAVTGTNGKTSTACFAQQIFAQGGHRSASLGTLGIVGTGINEPGSLTTPDTVGLHATLARLAGEGFTHVAMEASSHGLDQYRLDGITLKAAAFTNLTRDHLDYHRTMEAYLAAKAQLFNRLLPEGGTAVINADSDVAEELIGIARARRQRVLTYGRKGDDLRLVRQQPLPDGQMLDLMVFGMPVDVMLPVAGTFQAMNALAALGLAIGAGEDSAAALAALSSLAGVPGRIQRVANLPNGASIYVDYAHTPDALETVLKALRPHTEGRLHVVFGAGGDRDPGKRPQMGEVAERCADVAIVTDDNPRTEAPEAIRAQVMAACPSGTEIANRADAIRTAVEGLEDGDVLVIAGKGHEDYQIVGTVKHHFDDAEEARAAAKALGGEAVI